MRPRLAAIALLAAMIQACVEVPENVRQTFEPPRPGETSYYTRRPTAPRPEGFVTTSTPTATPTSIPTPSPTSTPGPTP